MHSFVQRIAAWPISILLIFGIVSACADNQTKPETKKESSPEGGSADQVATKEDPTPEPEENSDGDFIEDEPSDDGEIDSIAELTAQCGINDLNAEGETKLYEKTIKSLKVTKNLYVVTVQAQTTLELSVTAAASKQTTSVDATTSSPMEFLDGIAKAQVENIVKNNSGTTTFNTLPFSDYPTLGRDYETWKNTLCTFVPASKVVNYKGGYDTIVTFDPPLPSSLSPKADLARYEEEIGDSRTFSQIKATIKRSDNPDISDVDVLEGRVVIEKVSPKITVTGDEKSYDINADIAYKVTYEFGTPKETFAIGLPPEVTYYISNEKRDLIANVIDTKSALTGTVTFVHDQE